MFNRITWRLFCISKYEFSFLATQPPKEWPSSGNLEFSNVYLKYAADDPPVLKNLNFEIKNGWKVTTLYSVQPNLPNCSYIFVYDDTLSKNVCM